MVTGEVDVTPNTTMKKPTPNEIKWKEFLSPYLNFRNEEVPVRIRLRGGTYTNFIVQIPEYDGQPIMLECQKCWNCVTFFEHQSPEGVIVNYLGPRFGGGVCIRLPNSHCSSTKHLVHDCTP